MPYEVRLIKESTKSWPARIHNIYTGNVTTDDVVGCVNSSIRLLDQQDEPIDIIGIFEKDSNFLNAKGVLFQKPLMEQLTWHQKLNELILVDLNMVITGDFTKKSLQTFLSRPELKISIVGSMEVLDAFLTQRYEQAVTR